MATLTIPMPYLEDFRSAVISEIDSDSNMLSVNHAAVLASRFEGVTEDRSSAVKHLSQDMAVLSQVLDANDNTTVTADEQTLSHLLEQMARVSAGRLNDAQQYSPVLMGKTAEIAERLAWVSYEAVRLWPSLDERKVA
jgi:hypothetical protein